MSIVSGCGHKRQRNAVLQNSIPCHWPQKHSSRTLEDHTSKLHSGMLHRIRIPPPLHPREYGWEADDVNMSHSAITVAQGVCLAPDCLLKLIHCDCDSESSCKQQEWDQWGHRSPSPMYNILRLWGWSFMFQQIHYNRLCYLLPNQLMEMKVVFMTGYKDVA